MVVLNESGTRAFTPVSEEQAIRGLPGCFESLDKELWDYYKSRIRPNVNLQVNELEKSEKDYSGWDLSGVQFINCHFENCNFGKVECQSCRFHDCTFENCDFTGATFGQLKGRNVPTCNKCQFYKCTMREMITSDLSIYHTTFDTCDFTGSKLEKANIDNASFVKSTLSGFSLRWATLKKTLWDSTIVDQNTNFDQATFDKPQYSVMNDKSDRMVLQGGAYTNWKRIQFLSTIPLFEVSWLTLILSLIVVNGIYTLNETQFIQTLDYPVPLPDHIGWFIIGSILLALGTTIYKLRCPDIVRNFTEAQWVYEHDHPRPIYLVKSLQAEKSRLFAISFLISGGIVAGLLLFERVFTAMYYLATLTFPS